MTSIAIATLVGFSNFGNRLQNFALRQSLLSMGFDRVDTIGSQSGTHNGYSRVRRGYHLVRAQGAPLLKAGVRRLWTGASPSGLVNPALREFSAAHVPLITPGYVDVSHPGLDPDAYDFFIVGSDQVWNPVFGLPYGLDFLQFARERQRVSYAGSFGVDTIPWRLRSRYREGLRGIPHLSVREEQGRAIVRHLMGRDVPWVVDPTLLHDEQFWLGFAEGAGPQRASDYVAVALLGGGTSPEVEQSLAKARSDGLEIVDVLASGSKSGGLSPQVFLNLIAGSALVLTNSYHVSLFALLFGRPLKSIERRGMDSRIRSLFEMTGLACQEYSSRDESGIVFPDFDRVRERISQARITSQQYLTGSFG